MDVRKLEQILFEELGYAGSPKNGPQMKKKPASFNQ